MAEQWTPSDEYAELIKYYLKMDFWLVTDGLCLLLNLRPIPAELKSGVLFFAQGHKPGRSTSWFSSLDQSSRPEAPPKFVQLTDREVCKGEPGYTELASKWGRLVELWAASGHMSSEEEQDEWSPNKFARRFTIRYILDWARRKGAVPEWLDWASRNNLLPAPLHDDMDGRQPGYGAPMPDHWSEDLRTLVMASNRFWQNADPSDSSTYPKASQIKEWVKVRGLPNRVVESIGPLLTPKWAEGKKSS